MWHLYLLFYQFLAPIIVKIGQNIDKHLYLSNNLHYLTVYAKKRAGQERLRNWLKGLKEGDMSFV